MSLREIIPVSFADLLNYFGISLQSQKDNTFVLRGEVVPTVLVGSVVPITAVSNPMTLDVPYTAGSLAAGTAANTVHADTGALASGVYAVTLMFGCDATAGSDQDYYIQRRDAANAANIWQQEYGFKNSAQLNSFVTFAMRLNTGERLRVLNKMVSTFTTEQVSIWAQRIGA